MFNSYDKQYLLILYTRNSALFYSKLRVGRSDGYDCFSMSLPRTAREAAVSRI